MQNAIKIIDHTRPDDAVTEVRRHEASPTPRWGSFNLWEPPIVGEPPPAVDAAEWAGASAYEATVAAILAGAAPHTITWGEFAASGAALLHPRSTPQIRTRARSLIAAFAARGDSWRTAFEAVHRMDDALAVVARARPSFRGALQAFELWLDAAVHAHACGMALPGRAPEWENVADCARSLRLQVELVMKKRYPGEAIGALLASATPEEVALAAELARRAAVTGDDDDGGEPWHSFALSLSRPAPAA